MNISNSGINAPMVSMSASSSSSETSSASSSSAGIQGSQAAASPPVTQIVQAQLAQMQLTGSISSSTSSSTASILPPLTIHAPVTVRPPSSGGIRTFFQAVEREIKSYLLASLPDDYRTPPFDKPNLCKPGFETFNKFIQINKHYYELGKAFVNKLNHLEKSLFVCRAADRGCAALLKLARHCGVDLNQMKNIDSHGVSDETLLTKAILNDDVRVVGTLLSIGVNPNRPDGNDYTPFIRAAVPWYAKGKRRSHEVEMMKLLMQHGADINAKMVTNKDEDEYGYNYVNYVRKMTMTMTLLTRCGDKEMTALMMCRDQPERMKELLQLGVNKEVTTVKGETALMLLVRDVVRLLTKPGLEIRIRNIKQLVAAGANILVTNHAGDNLLSIAIIGGYSDDGFRYTVGGYTELMEELIQSYDVYCNANQASGTVKESMSKFLEIRDGRRRTPLMVAVERGCKESAVLLIKSGANLDAALTEGNVSKTVRNMMEERNEDGLWDEVLQVQR